MSGFRIVLLATAFGVVGLLAFDVTDLYAHDIRTHFLRSYDRMGRAGWQAALGTVSVADFKKACRGDFACWTGYGKDLFTAWPIRTVNAVLVGLTLLLIIAFVRTLPGPIEKDPGTAMWATAYQLRQNLRATKKNPLAGYFGIYWNRRMVQLPVRKRFSHCVVVGAPGAMKTTGYHKQNAVRDAEDGWSMIIVDMKYPEAKEGLGNLLPIIERIGNHELRLFLPYETFSHRFDVFELAKDQEGASELAGILFEAVEGEPAYYLNAKRTLVTGLLQALAHSPQPSLQDLVQILNHGLAGLKDFYSPDRAIPAEALENIMGTLQLPKEHGASVMKSAADRLFLFRNPVLSANLSGARSDSEEIDVMRLAEVPTALYIGLPQDKIEDGSGALLLQLTKKILDKYLQKAAFKNGGQVKNPVSFYLDEFANLGTIPNIGTNLATNRQRQISYHLSLQNLSQGKAIYGTVEFDALASGNIQSRMYFPAFIADDDRTEISERLGKITVREKSKSRMKGGVRILDDRAGSAEKKASRPLLSPEDMRIWPSNVAVLELNGTHPVQVVIPRFDQKWTWVPHFYRKQNRFSRFIYLPYRNPFYRYQKMIPRDFDLRLWSSARIRTARRAALPQRAPLPGAKEVADQPPAVTAEAVEAEVPATLSDAWVGVSDQQMIERPTAPGENRAASRSTKKPNEPAPTRALKAPPAFKTLQAQPSAHQGSRAPVSVEEPAPLPSEPAAPPQVLVQAFQAFVTAWVEKGWPVTLFGTEKKVEKVVFETQAVDATFDPETINAWSAAQLVKVSADGLVLSVSGRSLPYLPERFQAACLRQIAAGRDVLKRSGERVGTGPFSGPLFAPSTVQAAAAAVVETENVNGNQNLAAVAICLEGAERNVLESWLLKTELKGYVLPPDQPRLASSYRDNLALWVDAEKTLVMVRRAAVKKLLPRTTSYDALTRGGYPMLVFALPPSDLSVN